MFFIDIENINKIIIRNLITVSYTNYFNSLILKFVSKLIFRLKIKCLNLGDLDLDK